jgi:phosphoglycolate phosphatase
MPVIEHPTAKKRGAIFDLDGTIVDTLGDLAASLNRALSSLGYPEHDVQAYKAMVGNGMTKMAERALPEGQRDEARVAALKDVFLEDYALHLTDKTRPYPGIEELLENLRAMGWRLGCLSNKDHDKAVIVVEHFFKGLFDLTLGVTPTRSPKPDTAGALELAGGLGLAPKDIYYFGDSDTDMKLAVKAGFFPVGVAWGFRDPDNIMGGGAKAILGEPEDFLTLLPLLESGEL